MAPSLWKKRPRLSATGAIHAALVVVVSAIAACGQPPPTQAVGDLVPPAECAPQATPGDYAYPSGPYGTEVGDTFADFTLEDCDGNPVSFASILSHAELVLFNIGAGWCQPCIEETEHLDAQVFRPLCGEGLRVVQVLFEKTDGRPATKLFCKQWREEFGLSFPVLVDPLFTTEEHFVDVGAQTPVNMLIDRQGVIRYRETGTPAADIGERIRALLP